MNPKIFFIGGTPRGLELIKALILRKQCVVCAFIMKEDDHEPIKVSGSIYDLCQQNQIPATICNKITKEEAKLILEKEADVGFVCGWRTIIPKELYHKIPYGCLAAHDSLLPKYRGFAPTAWAIINGEKKTGVTLFKVSDLGVDAGEVFDQIAIPIGDFDTATDIYPKIVKSSVELYLRFLDNLVKEKVIFHKQDESKATYASRRRPEDGKVNWEKEAREVFNLTRALTPPYPYSWTTYHGEKIYILRSTFLNQMKNDRKIKPGTVLNVSNQGVLVACGDGQITLLEVMKESGEHYQSNQFFAVNDVLGD